MSPLAWTLIIISQLALVVGQIFLKRAMSRREHGGEKARGWIAILVTGIAAMTVWFLLWLGVMHGVDLSQQMPMEGISPAPHRHGGRDFSPRTVQLARLGRRPADLCRCPARFGELTAGHFFAFLAYDGDCSRTRNGFLS